MFTPSYINWPPVSCVTRNVVLRWLPWPPLGKWIITLPRLHTTLNHKQISKSSWKKGSGGRGGVLKHLCVEVTDLLNKTPSTMKIGTYEHIPHPPNMKTWVLVDSHSTCLKVIWTNPDSAPLTLLPMSKTPKKERKQWPPNCKLFHGFEDGWIRGALILPLLPPINPCYNTKFFFFVFLFFGGVNYSGVC